MAVTFCPNCDAEINITNPKLGKFIVCPECEVELEIMSVKPFEVDFIYEDTEDDYSGEEEWDDDEEEYDDEDWDDDDYDDDEEDDEEEW